MSETRVCESCQCEKPIEQFEIRKIKYRRRKCKECVNARKHFLYLERYKIDDEYRERKRKLNCGSRQKRMRDDEYRKEQNQKASERRKDRLKTDDEYRKKYNLANNIKKRIKLKTDAKCREEYNRKKREYVKKKYATDQSFRENSLLRRKEFRIRLSDGYINELFGRKAGNRLPAEVIEVKRLQLKIKRLIEDRNEKHN